MSHPDSNALRRLERQVRRRLDVRMASQRVWESLPAILQIVAAVTASYSIAHWGLGHAYPILAITVTINALGFARDARPQRVAETVIGILLGVALSDGLSLVLGKGLWQLVVVLLVVFVIGRAVSPNPAFAVAAAVPSALVLILPVPDGGPFGRTFDAAIGGAIALLATALIPRDPARAAARERRRLFALIDEGLATVLDALLHADTATGELALERMRRTQPVVDAWKGSLDSAVAIARISPFLRSRLPLLVKEQRVLAAADLATRHLRVVARRVEFLVRDGEPRPALAELLGQLRTGIRLLDEELDDPQLSGAARSLLTDVARRLDPAEVLPDAHLRDSALLLMLRPFVVDLLVGAGMPIDDARSLLPPV
ncbi:FUSC family protein [Leifsonia sp. H3M29-4]|uniref:FUSC family protein n=1 Tax=Salinibacterium metalliresistens TaxID=3031321 RepID=UPI0023DAFD70|nr:FUSC family protein [Salinibacterium metalliresistens]MDF1478224.1 FUSC family protein [Salinibacterium metalliresistens]